MNGSNSMKRIGGSSFHKDYEPVTHENGGGKAGEGGQDTYDIPVGQYMKCWIVDTIN